MTENEISYKIRGAIFKVYNTFGPGLLESVYEKALMIELREQGLHPKEQVPINVFYKGEPLGLGFRADILVDDKVVIELKSVKELESVFFKQTRTYIRLMNLKLGILVNFNTDDIASYIKRVVNGL